MPVLIAPGGRIGSGAASRAIECAFDTTSIGHGDHEDRIRGGFNTAT
jgi:hypothetical protein